MDLDLQSLNRFKSNVSKFGLMRNNRFIMMLSLPDKMVAKAKNVFGSLVGSDSSSLINLAGMAGLENVFGDSLSLAGSYLLSLRCKASAVPSLSFNFSETHINGRIKRVAISIDYDALTLEFYLDEDMLVHAFFMIWANIIFNQFSKQMGYYSEYVSRDSQLLILDSSMGQSPVPGLDLGDTASAAGSIISAASQTLLGSNQLLNIPGSASTFIFDKMWPTEIGEIRVDWENENQYLILPVTFRFEYCYTKIVDVIYNH